jgi:hypothetical protein
VAIDDEDGDAGDDGAHVACEVKRVRVYSLCARTSGDGDAPPDDMDDSLSLLRGDMSELYKDGACVCEDVLMTVCVRRLAREERFAALVPVQRREAVVGVAAYHH